MKLPKVYDPHAYEADIYSLWEKTEAFKPGKTGARDTYAIAVPPPNANGNLHLGHGLTLALEDIAVRYQRLRGKRALLLPGADHAGFETQVVYEKQLAAAGKSRFDFSREELYKQIWDFVAQNRDNFEQQFRRLGAGVDWSRHTFTLDEKIVKRAYATFKKMWDEGRIYRGERIVNFCTFHGTGFADIEVNYKEEQGSLWHIRYPLTDGSGDITVATTRPETMLGDTGVAVHPDDKRYAKYIGKTVKLPLISREIPVIADEFVETAFGTGAVKLTPAHDLNDFDAATRHNLPMITIIDHEGKLNANVPEAYRGLTVKEARVFVVDQLEKQGFLAKTTKYTHNVGHCYKCGTVIEPLLREQWFVDMKPLAAPAIKALEAKEITFYPDSKRTQLITYLEGLRDWNISRQIAWGIPIPAFQNVDDADDWIYYERPNQEVIEVDGKTYRRDPDVFDTWFSSSSWPYATLGYPDDADYDSFYPLSLMETGADILYPWVSRMLMFGLYNTGKIPFKAVYLHGLIQDEHGQKMSKSRGNVVNPMELVDEYGSDAFRMGIISTEAPGNNRPFDKSKIIAGRNFCNKLWNIARYVEDKVSDVKPTTEVEPISVADHWLLTRLKQSTEAIAKDLDKYRFAEAYDKLYHFVWDDLADWYIEASKAQENVPLLVYVLEMTLTVAHPFAPFVTETIWQTIHPESKATLAVSHWPVIKPGDKKHSTQFERLKDLTSEIRAIRKALGAKAVTLQYHTKETDFIEPNVEILKRLANVSSCQQVSDSEGLRLTQAGVAAWLDIPTHTAQAYATKLAEKRKVTAEIAANLKKRLANKNYMQNAPAAVVAQTKQQLEEAETQIERIKAEQKRYA